MMTTTLVQLVGVNAEKITAASNKSFLTRGTTAMLAHVRSSSTGATRGGVVNGRCSRLRFLCCNQSAAFASVGGRNDSGCITNRFSTKHIVNQGILRRRKLLLGQEHYFCFQRYYSSSRQLATPLFLHYDNNYISLRTNHNQQNNVSPSYVGGFMRRTRSTITKQSTFQLNAKPKKEQKGEESSNEKTSSLASATTITTTPSTSTMTIDESSFDRNEFATEYHAPVMAKECIEALLDCQMGRQRRKRRKDEEEDVHHDPNDKSPRWFVDGTLGGGGHSEALLINLQQGDVVFGCDVDPDALHEASRRLSNYLPSSHPLSTRNSSEDDQLPLFIPIQTNFKDVHTVISKIIQEYSVDLKLNSSASVDVPMLDGLLLDLGVSSFQIDQPERGFSFSEEGPLDMRMSAGIRSSDDGSSSGGFKACDICNEYSEQELQWIFQTYGDETRSRTIAKSIIEHRPLHTTQDLVNAISHVVPKFSKKSRRGGLTATCARIFQSLRIVVNREDVALKQAYEVMAPTLIKAGGRLVVLSYHSIEDRMTKRIMRDGTVDNKRRSAFVERDVFGNPLGPPKPWKPVGKRGQKATDEEIQTNPRARSATLRIAERQVEGA